MGTFLIEMARSNRQLISVRAMSIKMPMMIAVRGYAVPVRDDDKTNKKKDAKPKHKKRKTLSRPSDETVVFDTETSIDHAQHLRIGTYQVRKGVKLYEKGIFFEPDSVTPNELTLLKSYTEAHGLVLRTREEFVRDVLYLYGYDHGGLILGFNLAIRFKPIGDCHSHVTWKGYARRGSRSNC